jgi:hypothetical protein
VAKISASDIVAGKIDPERLPTSAAGSVTLTGDITGSGSGSVATTLSATQSVGVTWAGIQTFTLAPVFTDAPGTRTALGLGSLATQNGTFSGTHSGTSSGTNTGDQTISLTGDVTGSGTGSFAATIASAAVTTAKVADSAVTDAKHAAGAMKAAALLFAAMGFR